VDTGKGAPLADWLDGQEAEREALIMRLRQIERVLVKYGRLRRPALPPAEEGGGT